MFCFFFVCVFLLCGRSFFFFFKFLLFFLFGGLLMFVLNFCPIEGFGNVGFMCLIFQQCVIFTDFYSFFFNIILVLVSSSIVYYSSWYFESEPKKFLFFFFLIFFIFFMFLLTNIYSIFFLILGWESVSVMSFLLISWWLGRSDATQSGVQSVVYNRIGDFSLYLILMCLFVLSVSVTHSFSFDCIYSSFFTFFVVLAVVAKSSQFPFHPWLPNAMEGPTPVSSLLHSSTMVVASVFISIRIVEVFSFFSVSVLMFLSALTILHGAVCSLGQQDVKNIIAFSTTSQLGFMLLTCAVCGSEFSFFLLCMHAFFNSFLFMASSVYIHNEGGEQVTDKLSFSFFSSSFSSSVFVLASFSLISFPFFSGFYSKDLILENMWGPVLNRFCVLVFVVGSVFTVGYSFRLLVSLFSSVYFSVISGNKHVFENGSVNLAWMFFLSGSSFFVSFLSVSFLYNINVEEYVPFILNVAPLVIIFSGLCVSVLLFYFFSGFLSYGFYMFYFNPLMHRLLNNLTFFLGRLVVLVELFWIEYFIKLFVLAVPTFLSSRLFFFFRFSGLLSFFFFFFVLFYVFFC